MRKELFLTTDRNKTKQKISTYLGRFTNVCISFLGKDFYKLCVWKINNIRTHHNTSYSNRYDQKSHYNGII